MGINYQSAGNRLNNAMRLFEMASATGKYKTYENALYAFDVAIASGHDVAKAKKGKKDAQLA